MKYALAFLVFSIAFAAQAVLRGGGWWVLLYPAVSFGAVSAAYFGAGPRVFGKRADGSRAAWATALLGPFLLFVNVVWQIDRLLYRRRCCDEVAPGVWVGRRPMPGELPPGVATVVDVTAEFCPRHDRSPGVAYVCLPTLDATACDEPALRRLIAALAAAPGGLFIHCAQGRGRSAAVAAALLVRRGAAAGADDAEELLRRARPAVRLSPSQRRLVDRLASAPA